MKSMCSRACPFCGCQSTTPKDVVGSLSGKMTCRNCGRDWNPFAGSLAVSKGSHWVLFLVVVLTLLAFFSGCDKTNYDRGFKAGEKKGYSRGYSGGKADGISIGKTKGYAAGTASFISGTFIPNLGLILATVILATSVSWLSVHYIIPQHRAKQAKYDAENSIEKTRKQLKQKYQVVVRDEIKKLKANLKLTKHEQSLRAKLDKLFTDASLLLFEESNRLVDDLFDRQLQTIAEIANAGDLSTEERILLYPAAAAEFKSLTTPEKSNVQK